MKKILPLFSYVFHPVFVPLMGTILYEWVYRDSLTTIELLMTLIRIGIVTLLIPIVFLYFLRATGKIDSVMIEKPEQRKIPLGFQVLLMALLLMRTAVLWKMVLSSG